MAFLQGNTYLKPIQVLDESGKVVRADKVVKGEFIIGDIYKYYGESGDVQWNVQENAFIVPLTEEDTFSLKADTTSEVQVRLLLDDGSVSGSLIERHYVYRTKSTTRLTEGGAGEESGELLKIKLLKELGTGGSGGSGGIVEEIDPTVPQFVKNITEQDIAGWNNKATESYVDTKVAELIGSAPEMLDTLGELASAVKQNQDVISALKVPTKTSELTNDSGFITLEDIPQQEVDLSNYYTKGETEAYVASQIASSITEVLNTEV